MRSLQIKINTSALRNNVQVAKNIVAGAEVYPVLKADAYGHGATGCALALHDLVDGFAVVVSGEALALREAGIDKVPIFVLQGPQNYNDLQCFWKYDLDFSIHSLSQIELLEKHAAKSPYKVTVKIDTGMGRLGFVTEQLSSVLARLHKIKHLTIAGCMSHLASAEQMNSAHTRLQINQFTKCSKNLPGRKSLANSAGILAWPDTYHDWVRPGLMIYGANPLTEATARTEKLSAVMTVSAPIISISLHKQGDGIGYGQFYVCPRQMRIAYAAIGYGDGYPRHIKVGTPVLVNGQRCPIIGRISMDSIAIDISAIEPPSMGDLVIVWGDGLPVEEIADRAGTISYELLSQIRGQRSYCPE